MMTGPHSRDRLLRDLRSLGVEPGDLLFVHSSFKSLGPVEGGAGGVVAALEDAVGPEGLLLMPSFNLVEWERRAEVWDVGATPSTVGWLTEYFRLMSGTYRSDHYSHAVAARGKGARELVAGHRSQEGFRSQWDQMPWGKTYGTHSPMNRAYQSDGKLLMLGVDYRSSTYAHFIETQHWNRLLAQGLDVEYEFLRRPVVGEFWDRAGSLRRGPVGNADCRLFRIRDYVDTLLSEVERNPEPYWNQGQPPRPRPIEG